MTHQEARPYGCAFFIFRTRGLAGGLSGDRVTHSPGKPHVRTKSPTFPGTLTWGWSHTHFPGNPYVRTESPTFPWRWTHPLSALEYWPEGGRRFGAGGVTVHKSNLAPWILKETPSSEFESSDLGTPSVRLVASPEGYKPSTCRQGRAWCPACGLPRGCPPECGAYSDGPLEPEGEQGCAW